MKHQALFSSKAISKKIKVLFAAILVGTLRVKIRFILNPLGDIVFSTRLARQYV